MSNELNGIKKVATMCILRHKHNFLLLKRLNEPNKNLLTPVGGKLAPYESPIHSAMRETLEETGIRIEKVKFFGVLTETSPTAYNWISYVYLADIDLIEPPACNEGTLLWVAFNDLLSMPTPKTDWFIFKYIFDNKPFAFSAEYDNHLNILSITEEIEDKRVL